MSASLKGLLPRPPRKASAAAWALMLVTLLVGAVLACFHPVGYLGVETDFFGRFAPQVRNLLAGRGYNELHTPPGYAIVVGLLSLAVGNLFAAGKLLSVVAASAMVWLTCDLLTHLAARKLALAGAGLLALLVLPHAYVAGNDLPAAVLMLLPLWLVLRNEERGARCWLLAGVLCGAAYLLRYNAAFGLVALMAASLFLVRDGRAWSRLQRPMLLLAGWLLAASPWLLYNWVHNGSPFASTAYLQVAAHFFHPTGDVVGTALWEMAPRYESLLDVILADPPALALGYLRTLYGNTRQLAGVLPFPIDLLLGGGLLLIAAAGGRRVVAWLLWTGLGILLLGLVGFYERYYLFAFPLLTGAVAALLFPDDLGNPSFVHVLDRSPRWRRFRAGLTVTVLAVAALHSGRVVYANFGNEPRYILSAARALEERAEPGELIITRKPHVAYHAGLEWIFPLAETATEFRNAAEQSGARFLAYSPLDAELWPGLADFSDSTRVRRLGFRVLFADAESDYRLYELVERAAP